MMTFPDFINGAFEATGAIAVLFNVRTILRHKQVRGFHIGPMFFFTSWSLWNCYYYPHLDQWASTFVGAAMGLSNLIYLALVLYYLRKEQS